MSRKPVTARIEWIGPEAGGREAPPVGPRYSTVARFEGQADWPREAFSLVVERKSNDHGDAEWIATVSFLVPENAPDDFLRPGARFELFEGGRRVAAGQVLGFSDGTC